MPTFKALSLILALLSPAFALACEPPIVEHKPFVPNANSARATDIAAFVSRTKPVIAASRLSRGTPGDPATCGSMAYLTLQIALPAGAPVHLGDVGVDIRRVKGVMPVHVLAHGPVTPLNAADRTLTLTEVWFDGPPAQQKHLRATYEVTLVAPDGTRGPAQKLVLNAKPRKQADDPTR